MTTVDFPENGIEILHSYYSDLDLREFVNFVAKPYREPEVGKLFILDPESQAQNRARGELLKLLRISGPMWLRELNDAEGVYDLMKQRRFAEARDKLKKIPTLSVISITPLTIRTALSRDDFHYHTGDIRANPPRIQSHTVPGYEGPELSATQMDQLVALAGLATGGPEARFRKGVLEAEGVLGEAQSAQAQQDSRALYTEAVGRYESLRKEFSQGNDRSKFLAIRSGFAYIALGDFLFRRGFRFSSASERAEARTAYADANNLMSLSVRNSGKLTGQGPWSIRQLAQQSNLTFPLSLGRFMGSISPENPLLNQIVRRADQQLNKLDGGFNFLGYRDSYIPPLSMSTLAERAGARIQAAQTAKHNYLEFLKEKLDKDSTLRLLNSQRGNAVDNITIASQREGQAHDRLRGVREQISRLDSKIEDLGFDFMSNLTRIGFTVAATAAAGVTGGGSLAMMAATGIASAATDYLAANDDLSHQRSMAATEASIAERDERIARLEKSIVERQLAYIDDSIEALTRGPLNPDRLFALANAYEDMTRLHVDVAFELLYLLERAISFRRLKELHKVEGKVTQLDPLLAPDVLQTQLLDVLEDDAGLGGIGQNDTRPPWSLFRRHPIEFSQLIRSGAASPDGTGEAEFVISLYDVEKWLGLAGHENIRIKNLRVEVRGGVPPSGWKGSLTHRGTMMFRDKSYVTRVLRENPDDLDDPGKVRFTPTKDEMELAIRELESGRKDQAAVGGVVVRAADRSILTLSSAGGTVQPDPKDYGLAPLENYGVPGAWSLKLQGLNWDQVIDVWLHFGLSLDARDDFLEEGVDKLIRAYENELADGNPPDEIAAFSLEQLAPAGFKQLKETALTTLALKENSFPNDSMVDSQSKVKTVVVRVLDEDDKGIGGIAVEVKKPGTSFAMSRTTLGAGVSEDVRGFSEDVRAEIPPQPEPPPVLGTWEIRLPGRQQFDQLGKLILLFAYENA